MCLVLSVMVAVSGLPATAFAESKPAGDELIGDVAVEKFNGDEGDGNYTKGEFIKISHPETPASKHNHDAKKEPEQHAKEVFADGLLDYLPNSDPEPPYGVVEVPGVVKDALGDRGETYAWAAYGAGDWMYVCTLYNSTSSTARLLTGHTVNKDKMKETYGGDLFVEEADNKETDSTLSKINVKTGEVKILMSKAKNGIAPSFRNAVKFKDKLYFCGSINHLPGIFEIDPKNDAFQCVYQDPSVKNYPGGPGAAWKEATRLKICPSIRGLAAFKDHLIISTVGMDGNPYIAISKDPTSGEFERIANSWNGDYVEDTSNGDPRLVYSEKAELLGYPACRVPDSIMGGSIWEMVEYNGKLYVAIATGTPYNAPKTHKKKDEETGQERLVMDQMQSFALICGECKGDDPMKKDAWTWTPIVGDTKADGAKYTFGIDPERTHSSACHLVVYKDYLYIGEYTDTQIGFNQMQDSEFDYLAHNMDQSVSLYRLDVNNNIEKVMGHETEMFPTTVSGKHNVSGFGRQESMYIWQSRVFNGKLYLGTFDETAMLYPLANIAQDHASKTDKKVLNKELNVVEKEAESAVNARSVATEEKEVYQDIVDADELFTTRKEAGTFNDFEFANEGSPEKLLPAKFFKKDAIVKVNTPADLYLALMIEKDLMYVDQSDWTTKEKLASKVRFANQFEEITTYIDSNPENVPVALMEAAETFADEDTRANIKDMKDILTYLKDCIRGFDMYVTSDGANFEKITRTGMGDPYNQGLRTFASCDDPGNEWMTIGTANPFYGCQIWRMEDSVKNLNPVDPKQHFVKLIFKTRKGEEVKRDWDKAEEIHLNEGETKVDADKIAMLAPLGYKFAPGQNELEEKTDENGVKYVEIIVQSDGTITQLKKPEAFTAKANEKTGKIDLTWKKVEVAAGYRIEAAEVVKLEEGAELEYKTLAKVDGGHNTKYVHADAKPGATYKYRIYATANDEIKPSEAAEAEALCKCAKPVVTLTNDEADKLPVLSWEAVDGAAKYEVARSEAKDGEFVKLAEVTEPNYKDETVKANKSYFYKVTAVCEANAEANATSDVVEYVVVSTKLDAPVVTVVNDEADKLPVLSWEAVEGADKYEVARSEAKDGDFAKLAEVTETNYKDETAEPGKTYYYQVTAISEADAEANATSEVVECVVPKITLDAPTEFAVTLNDKTGKPELKWNKVNGAEKYEVYVVEGEEATKLETVTETTYTHDKAVQGTKYTYKVRAIAAGCNDSEFTNEITKLCKCVKPVVKAEINKEKNKPALTWNSVEGADKYEIYRSDAEDGTFEKVGYTKENTYIDTKAEDGREYYYQVEAICSANAEANAMSEVVKCYVPEELTDVTLSSKYFTTYKDVYKYASKGKHVDAKPIVKNADGKTLEEGVDYTVTYSNDNRVLPGKYTITVKGFGKYTGTVEKVLIITPKAVEKVNARLGAYNNNGAGYDDAYVTWAKSKGADGYYVYMRRPNIKDNAWKLAGRVEGTSLLKKDLADGYKYEFKVLPYVKADINYKTNEGFKAAPVQTLMKAKINTAKKYNNERTRITWTNVKGVTGYQVMVSAKGNTRYFTIKGAAANVKVVRNAKTTFKVRAYKEVKNNSGKTIRVYAPWSDAKSFTLR